MDAFIIVYDKALMFNTSPIYKAVLTVHGGMKFSHLKINGKFLLVATGIKNVILQIYTADQNMKFPCWLH